MINVATDNSNLSFFQNDLTSKKRAPILELNQRVIHDQRVIRDQREFANQPTVGMCMCWCIYVLATGLETAETIRKST